MRKKRILIPRNSVWKTRLVKGAFPDRSFDIEFWQEQGDEAIFAAAWELIELSEALRLGQKPTLERTVTTLKKTLTSRIRQPFASRQCSRRATLPSYQGPTPASGVSWIAWHMTCSSSAILLPRRYLRIRKVQAGTAKRKRLALPGLNDRHNTTNSTGI